MKGRLKSNINLKTDLITTWKLSLRMRYVRTVGKR